MKEYLKMADGFDGMEVSVSSGIRERLMSGGGEVLGTFVSPAVAKHAAHAINSHDELVQMNKELLVALEALDDIYSDTSRDYLTRSELQHHKAVRADVQIIIAKAKGGTE